MEEAYNPSYGARPIRRYLEKEIGTSVGRMILTNELLDNSTIFITQSDGKIEYQVEQSQSRSPKRTHAQMMEEDKNGGGPVVEDLDEEADVMDVDE